MDQGDSGKDLLQGWLSGFFFFFILRGLELICLTRCAAIKLLIRAQKRHRLAAVKSWLTPLTEDIGGSSHLLRWNGNDCLATQNCACATSISYSCVSCCSSSVQEVDFPRPTIKLGHFYAYLIYICSVQPNRSKTALSDSYFQQGFGALGSGCDWVTDVGTHSWPVIWLSTGSVMWSDSLCFK